MKYRPVETLEARLVCATRLLLGLLLTLGPAALASAATGHGGEASLVLPNLDDASVVSFLGGMSGWSLLSYGLRACHQHLGVEGFTFPEAAAIAAVSRPALFTRQALSVDVETEGRITRGMTVFDRRPVRTWRPNVDVLTDVDTQGLHDYVMSTLRRVQHL